MSFNSFGFGLDEDDRNPFERDFFDLSDTVGVDGKNNPQDVIKAEIILGNLGDLDLDRTDGPTSLWGQPQEDALKKYQQRNYLKIDGYMKPRGPTITRMRSQAENLLGGFNAPTPSEVIKHHRDLNREQPILSLKHPPIKLKPIADLPGLDDGAAFHAQRSADYLETIYDLGDWPRWTAKEIQDGGASAIATTRDVLDRLKQRNADQAAKLARAVVEHLPGELKTAFVGGPVPPALPRWVRSNEIMNRIVRLQAERDHGFDMGEDDAPRSMAEMEMRKPPADVEPLVKADDDPEDEGCAVPMVYREGMTYDCKRGGWRPETPEEQARPKFQNLSAGGPDGSDIGGGGGGGAGPGRDQPDSPSDRKPEPDDDPDADEYRKREGQDPDEAIREYWRNQQAQVSEPPTTDAGGVTYGRKPDGSPYASAQVPLPPIAEGGDVGEVPTPKEPFMLKPGETFPPIDKPEIRNDEEGKGAFNADREGGRKHKGIDLLTNPGERIRSPVDGEIVSIGSAYKDENAFGGQYRAVTIRGDNGETYVLRYISPTTEDGHPLAKVGGRIAAGQVLGIAQDRAKSGKGAMKNHIHVERYGRSGELLDPTPEFQKWRNR